MGEAVKYWQDSWKSRIKDEGSLILNSEKKGHIQEFLNNFHFNGMSKLDIGCGPCHHAVLQQWDNYTGVDLSEAAIAWARNRMPGATLICGDVLDLPEDKEYEVIMTWDTFEHITLDERLAAKIRKVAAPNAIIIGNIPLTKFTIHSKEFEHHIDYTMLADFLIACGFPLIRTECFYTRARTKNKTDVWLPFLLFLAQRMYYD